MPLVAFLSSLPLPLRASWSHLARHPPNKSECTTPHIRIAPPSCIISVPRRLPQLLARLSPARVASFPRPVRNAHIAIFTDFSADPFLAVRDRARDPVFAGMLLVAALVGFLLSTLLSRQSSRNRRLHSVESSPSRPKSFTSSLNQGESSVWLNMTVQTLWRLFRKSTSSLTRDVIQPVLDTIPFPNYIRSVQLSSLSLGESPLLLRDILRIPSRSISEVQYRFTFRLVGDPNGQVTFRVNVKLPGLPANIIVPIQLNNLDIDVRVWLSLTFVPYPPFVRFVQWALDDLPAVKFSINIASFVPVTAVPMLSNLITRVIAVDLPKRFLFPNARMVDMLRKTNTNIALDLALLDESGVMATPDNATDDDLRAAYPGLSGLFDALDVNDDGVLSKDELSAGLIDWGFASTADQGAIIKLIDVSNDGKVQLREFLTVWGDLQSLFVPRRFRGVISGVLVEADGLRKPLLGSSNPYVIFRVEGQSVNSRTSRSISIKQKKSKKLCWDEGWELYVQQPQDAVLSIEVREAGQWVFYTNRVKAPAALPVPGEKEEEKDAKDGDKKGSRKRKKREANKGVLIGHGRISVAELTQRRQKRAVSLNVGGGSVLIEVEFNEFVNPQYGNDIR